MWGPVKGGYNPHSPGGHTLIGLYIYIFDNVGGFRDEATHGNIKTSSKYSLLCLKAS